jgi:hypothetical protein
MREALAVDLRLLLPQKRQKIRLRQIDFRYWPERASIDRDALGVFSTSYAFELRRACRL